MSLDPWAALEARRRQRYWRNWPWGGVAVLLAAVPLFVAWAAWVL